MFEFDLNLTPGGARPVLYASAGDIGRTFKANLFYNGKACTLDANGFGDITDEQSGVSSVKIRGKKPDETVFDYNATWTAGNSYVTFSTTEQMTIIPGPVECELVFSQGSDVIATANFVLFVEESPYNPDAPSESLIPSLLDLVQDNFVAGTSNIADNAITSAKIKDGEVKTADIADHSITSVKIQGGAVDTAQLAASAVNADKIWNGAVTWPKLATAVQNRITTLESDVSDLEARLTSGDEADADLHLGFYLDENGDLCQVN